MGKQVSNADVEDCWNEAFHSFGSAKVFEDRARVYKTRLNLLTYLGIAVPASIGLVVTTWKLTPELWTCMIGVAGLLLFLQLVVSIWAAVAGWQATLEYATESHTANQSFYERFKRLAQNATNVSDFHTNYLVLKAESDARSVQDERQCFSSNEKPYGYRAACYELNRICRECQKAPASLAPSNDCDTCGRFKRKGLLW